MKSNVIIAVLVVLIIVVGAAGTYAGYALQPQPQTKTVTTTASGQIGNTSLTGACSIPGPTAQITLGFQGESGVDSAYYVAQEMGFYKQQGLSVTEKVVSPTVLADSLVDGQFQFGMSPPMTALSVYVQNASIDVMMGNFVNPGTSGVVVSSSLYNSGQVTNLTGLNGLKVGALAAPSGAWYIGTLYAHYYNVNWTQIPFASYTTMIAAFKTGQIQAAVALNGDNTIVFSEQGPGVALLTPLQVNASFWTGVLTKNGYTIPNGGQILGSSLLANAAFVNQNPGVVQRFINAFTEANLWVAAHTPQEVLNVAYQDPTMQAGGNESNFLPDVQILKNGLDPAILRITPADWNTTVAFTVATTPSLQPDIAQLIKGYNTLVNTTYYDNANFCFNSSQW